MANANATNASDANANAPTVLAPRVLLAFDDFSLAGRHLLHQLTLDGATRSPLAPSALPDALAPHARVFQFSQQDQKPTLSVVTVATATLGNDGASLWTLADALVQWLSLSDVSTVRVVASLHLPQAKPRAEPLANVYTTAHDALAPFDASWEVADAFLTRLLHFARVEQAFETQLLVVKGYKPGRDGAGTLDALTALAAALPLVVKGATVDVAHADADARKAQLADKQTQQSGHNLLYQ